MSGEDEINWTAVFSALANDQRRKLLHYLIHSTGEAAITDVAEHLSVGDPAPSDADDCTGVNAELHHVHLPTLVDADLITWDQQRNTVALTPLVYHLPVGFVIPQLVTPTRMFDSNKAGD